MSYRAFETFLERQQAIPPETDSNSSILCKIHETLLRIPESRRLNWYKMRIALGELAHEEDFGLWIVDKNHQDEKKYPELSGLLAVVIKDETLLLSFIAQVDSAGKRSKILRVERVTPGTPVFQGFL